MKFTPIESENNIKQNHFTTQKHYERSSNLLLRKIVAEVTMYYDFTIPKKKIFGTNKFYPTLIIDNKVIEYSFLKSRSKTNDELKFDVLSGNKKFFKPVSTIVSVYMDMEKIQFVQYDKTTNKMLIGGRFHVAYRNMHTSQEIKSDFTARTFCISFDYNFKDLEMFLKLIRQYLPENQLVEMEPLSL